MNLDFNKIEYILLDMDGTLLDRHFDDYFWEHFVPEKYAEKKNVSIKQAKGVLMSLYKSHEGTLNWTDIDFWSRELDLDIPALKELIKHLVEVHPGVEEFLVAMKTRKKKVFLLTNAHYKSISLKFKKTGIGIHFDKVISSFDMGCPKEDLAFWKKAQGLLGFDCDRSLFIDDTEEILKTARRFGIKHLLHKTAASSKDRGKPSEEFVSFADYSELLKLI